MNTMYVLIITRTHISQTHTMDAQSTKTRGQIQRLSIVSNITCCMWGSQKLCGCKCDMEFSKSIMMEGITVSHHFSLQVKRILLNAMFAKSQWYNVVHVLNVYKLSLSTYYIHIYKHRYNQMFNKYMRIKRIYWHLYWTHQVRCNKILTAKYKLSIL